MATLEPYYLEPHKLQIIIYDSSGDSEVDDHLKKKDTKSAVGFESDGTTPHKHSLASKYSFKMAIPKVVPFKMNFFRIAGTSETETLVSGKAECLLAVGENKKVNFLE